MEVSVGPGRPYVTTWRPVGRSLGLSHSLRTVVEEPISGAATSGQLRHEAQTLPVGGRWAVSCGVQVYRQALAQVRPSVRYNHPAFW